MEDLRFIGPLIRLLRLKKNWSQETLCDGVCTVSYLSKIEQGKATPNEALMSDILCKLGISWRIDQKDRMVCEDLYEGIFSWEKSLNDISIKILGQRLDCAEIGPCYLDMIVIKAYLSNDPAMIPAEMASLLTDRQRCLYALIQDRHEQAFSCYPCALSAYCVAEEAYYTGNYTYALEYLHIAFEKASQEGYAHLMMVCQSYMANCYSDIGNMDAMQRHSLIARRLARALDEDALLNTIEYNLAATELEHGNVEQAYAYFSKLEEHSVLSLHKLAICCESLGRKEEAVAALEQAFRVEEKDPLEIEMCDLVYYRVTHPDYLRDLSYGERLMSLFQRIQDSRHHGFVKFHLPWVLDWLKINRKYKDAYELLLKFPEHVS